MELWQFVQKQHAVIRSEISPGGGGLPPPTMPASQNIPYGVASDADVDVTFSGADLHQWRQDGF